MSSGWHEGFSSFFGLVRGASEPTLIRVMMPLPLMKKRMFKEHLADVHYLHKASPDMPFPLVFLGPVTDSEQCAQFIQTEGFEKPLTPPDVVAAHHKQVVGFFDFTTRDALGGSRRRLVEWAGKVFGIQATNNPALDRHIEAAYRLLGLEPGAALKEVKRAFRALSAKYHPDKVATESQAKQREAHERFAVISAAYQDLMVHLK